MKLRVFILFFLCPFTTCLASGPVLDSLYDLAGDSVSAEFFRLQGKALYKQLRYDEACIAYEEARKFYSQEGDSVRVAKAYNYLGLAKWRKGELLEASKYFLDAARLNSEHGELKGLANNNLNLGNLYAEYEMLDKAHHYLERAYSHFSKINHKNAYAAANTLGVIHYEESYSKYNLDTAEYYLTMAYKGYEQEEEFRYLPGIEQNFGVVEEKRENFPAALDYYIKAREGFSEVDAQFHVMRVDLNIGNMYLKLDRPAESLIYFEEGLKMAGEIENNLMYLDFLEQLVRTQIMLGNMDKVEFYFEQFDSLEEFVLSERVSKQIAELDAKYQKDLNEQEIMTKEAILLQKTKENNIILVALAVVLVLTVLIIIFYSQRQKIQKQLGEKRVKLHHQEVNKMLQDHELERMNAMISGQEKERHRIATDLHDRLGSTLSAVKLHMNAFERMKVASDGREEGEHREKLVELLDRAVNEVREISHDMLSGVLTKFGLAAALNDLKETLESSKQYRVHLQIMNLHNRVDNTLELNLYRIVQELVSNILKHAYASMITIQLNKLDDEIILMVEDDGIGFDQSTGSGEGVGLQNVADRVRSLGGHLHVDTQPGRGATITVEIPTP